jgi:CubicO group peptidase (beta-lactamase class C family)
MDAPIADLAPRPLLIDDSNWEKARQITLRHAMQMASGLDYRHDPCCHPIYDVREDRLVAALLPPLVSTPGTRYQYSDGDASLMGAAIAGAAGVDLLSFAKVAVFEPLNMGNADWMFRDRAGRFPGGWGLRLRPMDMLKLGQLYLQSGRWNGRRIFADDFARQAWAPGVDQGYAFGWRIANPAAFGTPYFWAQGFKGQRIFVFPEWKIVVAISASLPGSEESQVMRTVIPGLVDARRKGPDVSAEPWTTLKSKEGLGFRGETRTQQENQDAPRRF